MAIYVVTWDFSTTIRDQTTYKAMADAARAFCAGFKDNATEITKTTWAIDTEHGVAEVRNTMVKRVLKAGKLVETGEERDYLFVQRAFPQSAGLSPSDDSWFKAKRRRWK